MRDFKKEILLVNSKIKIMEDIKNGYTKVKCKCLVDGYEWETLPYDLLRGFGCHMCKGVTRYTTATFKEKMLTVDPSIEILGDYKRSHSKIKWTCKVCSNIHETKPNSLLNGYGCANCHYTEQSEKQKKNTNVFKKEVNVLVGSEYEVIGEYKHTDKDIKFLHTDCGFVFDSKPHNFLSGSRCPKCNGGVRKKTTKYFKKEVEEITDGKYVLVGDYKGSQKYTSFKHAECGSVFKTTPTSFLGGTRCPNCFFISKGELKIKKILEENSVLFEQQKTFEGLKDNRKLRFDFYLPEYNTCIEYDGRQHFEPIDIWGGKEELFKIKERDLIKNKYCKENSIKLLRIHYKDKNLRSLVKEILHV